MSKYITECETDQSHTYLNQGNGCPLCRIATLEALLREAYGYTTAADSLLPERIRTALGRAIGVLI